ncbi:cytochrome c biogenesis CcdA family protein [Deinococcus multiflagellatus]|uniref:Cytochrome c biogenesis CcdA family protein n=1 Tax=Deinococcus multiflagellatus TaxID=1656887 RepID=A0ABW1ZQM5_9DEIO|nr:cytochrome c biogenesis CcdA family protein [Deinococcus multiflagellatus]MBZ9715696.1 cytochrome c biogenesis CcdA family protein [Deinococcus multiflagellatus]
MTPTFTLAFLAGLLSCLSPCVLPLLPSYVGVLGGARSPLKRALGFIAGFTLVFLALGATASTLGAYLAPHKIVLGRAGGVVMIVFGLFMLGLVRLPLLERDYRSGLAPGKTSGPLILGVAFGFGWSPCIGPVLGSVLGLAASSASLSTGVTLLGAYSLGLAVPFILIALLWQRVNLRALQRYSVGVERVGGVILVATGFLMVSDQFTRLASLTLQLMPSWLQGRL